MVRWLSRLDRSGRLAELTTPWWNRRTFMLARHIASALPGRGTVLFLFPGDGRIGRELMRLRPDLGVEGLDVAPHPDAAIPVVRFAGPALPLPDQSVDYVLLIDVLHRTADAADIMREAGRVARRGVVIKAHLRQSPLAGPTLTVMDWFAGGVAAAPEARRWLDRREWQGEFFRAHLQLVSMSDRLDLHLPPARWLLDRKLHFLAYLTPRIG